MPSQHDYQRVSEGYLKPLAKVYGKSPSDAQLDAFVEDLCDYGADVLGAAVKVTRRSRKFFPSISDAMADCEEARQALRGTDAKPQQMYADKHPEYTKEAEHVMRSEFGQMALREGWGDYLFIMTRRTGRTDWNERDAVTFRAGFQRGVDAAMECDKKRQLRTPEEQQTLFGHNVDAAINNALFKLWEGMQARERWLAGRFLRQEMAA